MPRAREGDARRASGVAALLLQLRPTTPSAEVWAGNQDAGDAGGTDHESGHVSRNLLGDDDSFVVARRDVHAYHCPPPQGFFVATLDGGSTLREQILDISKAYAESMVEPDGVADDFGRKSISAVARRLALHSPILSVTRST